MTSRIVREALLAIVVVSFACAQEPAPDQAQSTQTAGAEEPAAQVAPPDQGSADRAIDAGFMPREPKRWYHVPLPFVESSSLPPGPFEPLSAREKTAIALRRTVGPRALMNRAILAGWNHRDNRPEEWGQGWDAYGHRLGYRMARLATRNTILLGFDLAMRTDPRYDRCDCSGFRARTLHSWKRVFVARTDSGGERVNLARVAGAYAAPAIAFQMLPDRYKTTSDILRSGSQYLGWRIFGNTIREFWPEIHRLIKIGPRPSSRVVD